MRLNGLGARTSYVSRRSCLSDVVPTPELELRNRVAGPARSIHCGQTLGVPRGCHNTAALTGGSCLRRESGPSN